MAITDIARDEAAFLQPVRAIFGTVRKWLKVSFLFLERILVGVWLLLLYGAAIWMVLATVVSFHFQADISVDTSREEILTVISIQNRKKELEWALQDHQRALARITLDVAELFRRLDRSVREGEDQSDEISREIERKKSNQAAIRSRIEATSVELEQTKSHFVFSDDPKSAQIRKLVGDFLYMREWGFDEVALMPSQLLTLILTISMGAFGSVIHLTWEFFDKTERRRLSWYVFRPFLGAVLAFAIFILLKSGQMVITNSGGAVTGERSLNPYFVSFLAIVSGILSEQAYAKISAAGTRLFSPPEKQRWVRRDVGKKAMAERGLEAEGLSQFLNTKKKKSVEAMLDGEIPLSEHQQEIVAAWLGAPSRDLFTDQAMSAGELDGEGERPQEASPEHSDEATVDEESAISREDTMSGPDSQRTPPSPKMKAVSSSESSRDDARDGSAG